MLGAPCILFSRHKHPCLSMSSSFTTVNQLLEWFWTFEMVRYGKREGFANVTLKKVHDAATKIQSQCDVSIHENVLGYEEAGIINTHHSWYNLHLYILIRYLGTNTSMSGLLGLESQDTHTWASDAQSWVACLENLPKRCHVPNLSPWCRAEVGSDNVRAPQQEDQDMEGVFSLPAQKVGLFVHFDTAEQNDLGPWSSSKTRLWVLSSWVSSGVGKCHLWDWLVQAGSSVQKVFKDLTNSINQNSHLI